MGDGKAVLRGAQTVTNIKRGSSHATAIYIYPNALEKYGREIKGVDIMMFIKESATYGKVAYCQSGLRRPSNWRREDGVDDATANWHATPFDLKGIQKYETLKLKEQVPHHNAKHK